METLRLHRLQHPSHVERLLHAFVRSAGVLPEGACAIADPSELPAELQPLITVATRAGQSWAGWAADACRVWLFTAELSVSPSPTSGPVLQVHLYREDGYLKESGLWAVDPEGQWHRHAG